MTTRPTRTRGAAVALLALALAALAPAADPAEAPKAADVKEATDALRDVFEKDYKAAEADNKAKRELARKLFDLAPQRKTAAMQYACLDEARKLAAAGGDAKLAFGALAALAGRPPVTSADLAAETLKLLGAADLAPADAAELFALAAEMAAAALDHPDENYAGAVAFAQLAVDVAKKAADPDRALEARQFLARAEALKAAAATLKTEPDNAAANEALGRYWVLSRGRWDRGLKHLAKGGNKDLAKAAAADLAGPKTAKDRTAVGESWYKLAPGFTGDERRRLLDRACEWYAAALAVATGDEDLKPSERLKEIEMRYPELFEVTLTGHAGAVAAVAVTPDGKTLVSVGNDNAIRLWDAATGKALAKLDGHTGWVGSVVVTPDGAKAVTAGGDNVIRVWDLKSGKEVARLEGHAVAVRGLALTADGKTLVSGGSDKTCRAWDLSTGKELKRYGTGKESVESVAVTPDGAHVLAGSDQGTVTVYDAKTGAVVSKFDKHNGTMVYTVAVSADGKTALSGARDKDVHVWEVATGKEVRSLAGHTEQVYQIALSPDGKRAASAGYDKSVRLWDLATGKELKRFDGHTDGVQGVCFTPDGRYLFSASWDKTVRKWRAPVPLPVPAKKVD